MQQRTIDPITRERIFGLYAGQKIMTFDSLSNDGNDHFEKVNLDLAKYPVMFLKVTPLWKITKEDAIEVAGIIEYDDEYWQLPFTEQLINYIRNGISIFRFLDDFSGNFDDRIRQYEVIDFLRSKGYALPAFGFSVKELKEQNLFWWPDELEKEVRQQLHNKWNGLVEQI